MTAPAIPFEPMLPPAGRAVSSEAKVLRGLFEVALDPRLSIVLGKRDRDLESACLEAAVENWDGYGAEPVDRAAYERARVFLRALPVTAPDPEISVDPDGEVSFTWQREPRKVFSISVGRSRLVSYAGVFGPNTTYGDEHFVDELPQVVKSNLARLFPAGA